MVSLNTLADCGVTTPGRPGRRAGSELKEAIELSVASIFRVRLDELRAPTRRSADTAFARQVAMYLAHVVGGLTLTDVGDLFARDRTTVAHACRLVEDRRDEAELDRGLEHLERVVAALIEAFTWRGNHQ